MVRKLKKWIRDRGTGLQVRYDIEKSGSACFGWIHENWIQDSDSGLDSLPNEDSVQNIEDSAQNIEDSLFSMFKYMFWEDSS